MLPLYKKIESLCSEKSVNITTMCKEAEVPRSALSDYKTGRKKTISITNLEKIANYFDVSVDYLLGKTDIKKLEQSDDELLQLLNDPKNRELFEKLMSLSEKEIDFIEAQIKVIESHRDM